MPGNRCGKVSFLTRSGVEAAAMLQGERHRVPTRAYRCPFGHGWHLTTQALRSVATVDGPVREAGFHRWRDAVTSGA